MHVLIDFRWFAVLSSFSVPLILLSFFAALVISEGYYFKYLSTPFKDLDQAKLKHWSYVENMIS